MLLNSKTKTMLIITVMILFSACGGNNSSTPINNTEEPVVQIENNLTDTNNSDEMVVENNNTVAEEETYKLTFVDSPVVNLTYECGDKIARTDSDGNLSCASFPIVFSALEIEIGTLKAMTDDHKVFPQDLVGVYRRTTHNIEVKKIASFLQSLDDDGDVSKFIVIQDSSKLTKQEKEKLFQKRELRRLVDMRSREVSEFLRAKGFREVSLFQAEQNLRQYSLGLAPYSPPIAVPTTPPDTIKPVVTLNGNAMIELYLGHTYTELNATATDNIDGNVTSTIVITGTVNTSEVRENNITYTATDSAGNEGNVTRTVKVLPILKKTGQTKSYDTDGNEVVDGSIKDDGFYQKGTTPSYTRDDENETVTDNLTGLMWQDDSAVDSVTKPWLTEDNYNTCRNDTTSSACFDTTGDTATTYCNELVMGGYDDWRLPTSVELEGIVHYGVKPSIDNTKFRATILYYWSYTSIVGQEYRAWYIDFGYGHDSSMDKNYYLHIMCVREKK